MESCRTQESKKRVLDLLILAYTETFCMSKYYEIKIKKSLKKYICDVLDNQRLYTDETKTEIKLRCGLLGECFTVNG